MTPPLASSHSLLPRDLQGRNSGAEDLSGGRRASSRRLIDRVPRHQRGERICQSSSLNLISVPPVAANVMISFGGCDDEWDVVYQGPNQTNQDSIKAWLKHEEPNSTRQQQEVINQTLAPARLNTPCNRTKDPAKIPRVTKL